MLSVRVQSAVWEHSRATGNAFVVLLKIADNCDDDGRNAWPSVATLARYCRCAESTVQRALRELEALGELEVAQQMGGPRAGSRYAPNRYRVLLDMETQSSKSTPVGRDCVFQALPPLVVASATTAFEKQLPVSVLGQDGSWPTFLTAIGLRLV